ATRPARLGRPDEPGPFRMTSERRSMESAARSTLEGVLEKSSDDRWVLRRATGDVYLLEGHPRLDLLNPGDTIKVEGRLIQTGPARYSVDHVLEVRHGS